MGVSVNPHPPNPIFLFPAFYNKNAWIQKNGMNRCGTYYPLSSHLDILLCCLNVFSYARSS